MRTEVEVSMTKAGQWASIAVPAAVQVLWPGATIYRVEDDLHPACKLLDTNCGIDWLAEYQGLVKGLSVRCQGRQYAEWRTFTIRDKRIGARYSHESELNKAIRAEQQGAITAAYQLHAYMDVDEGPASEVIAWGLARRVALFHWVIANPGKCISKRAYDEGQMQTFEAVRFADLPSAILVAQHPPTIDSRDRAMEDHIQILMEHGQYDTAYIAVGFMKSAVTRRRLYDEVKAGMGQR